MEVHQQPRARIPQTHKTQPREGAALDVEGADELGRRASERRLRVNVDDVDLQRRAIRGLHHRLPALHRETHAQARVGSGDRGSAST